MKDIITKGKKVEVRIGKKVHRYSKIFYNQMKDSDFLCQECGDIIKEKKLVEGRVAYDCDLCLFHYTEPFSINHSQPFPSSTDNKAPSVNELIHCCDS